MQGSSGSEGSRILVVDDNPLSAKKLEMTVRALGHDVESAFDGASALERLRRHDFDAVFLDIVMPEVDGFAVLAEIKSDPALQDLPVIVVSSLENETDSVARALELGAEDFLPKSFDLTIMKARLGSTLLRKRYRDRELAYLRDVETLTQAAEVIEAGSFRPSDLDIARVSARPDQLGRLSTVLLSLTQAIYERERQNDLRARTLWGTIMVIIAGCLFAAGPSFGRLGAEAGLSPLSFAISSNLVGIAVCLVIAFARSGPPKLKLSHLGFCLVWAVIYGCAYNLWLVHVAAYVEASTIALISSSRAFMVFALSALIALERPSARRLLGLVSGSAAVALVLLPMGAMNGGQTKPWLVAALGLPLLLTLHTLLMAWRPKDLDEFSTTALMLAIATLLLGAAGTAGGEPILPARLDMPTLSIILAFGVATSIAIALALEIVARAGAVFASQMAYIQTLAGIAWGMILLDETLPPLAWGAVCLVIIGFVLVQPKQAGDEFSMTIPIEGQDGDRPGDRQTGTARKS
jgi:CheY-like chemotaxis protein/drug/metabolite transporter (DMT)-like permease